MRDDLSIGHGVILVFLSQTAPTGGLGWRTWAPVASAVVATVALLVAFSNRRVARKALRLSEQQEERRTARLSLSLVDAVSWRPAGQRWRWIGVQLVAVNPTDRDGALVTAELHVTYTTASGSVSVVKITSDRGFHPSAGGTVLDVPARLAANDALGGWLGFKLPDDLARRDAIQRYQVTVVDSRGPVETVEAGILRDIRDETAS